MSAILTITLSPCLDIATSVAGVVPGPKLRCAAPVVDPGGGGVNAARAIQRMGGETEALVVVGGPTGERVLALLAAEGIQVRPVHTEAETRISFAATDTASSDQYRFSLPAVPLTERDVQRLPGEIFEAVAPGAVVVLSGSQPDGMVTSFPADLAEALRPKTDRLILDTSGEALFAAVASHDAPLYLLRIDQKEAREASAQALETIDDSIGFAASLVSKGVARVVVTGCGAAGSILVTEERRLFCAAPKVPVESKIGAGDSFVGALSYQIGKGASLEDALRWGVAAASATVMTPATELCHRSDIERLVLDCVIEDRL